MKKLIITTLLLVSQLVVAQKYFTRTGTTHFKASVETFEPVEAINNSSTSILNVVTGDIAVQLFISAFQFKVALMQEHFNENYMDSDTYPKATFRGKLSNFSLKNSQNQKEFPLQGTLTICGIKKEISTIAKVSFEKNIIKLSSNFSVEPQDFGIEIPSIVRKKIAEKINIKINYELAEKK
ncbi:YceI family protein [uncultured Tenacibaculum sp.]|uniref:YceI family protein n=1 Tax=uncultured Tenacibaculum sp. TaxID=174713 RepID=UPI0026390DF6|nr:YceI family protein [uncultured Tenacibaculum sp.]